MQTVLYGCYDDDDPPQQPPPPDCCELSVSSTTTTLLRFFPLGREDAGSELAFSIISGRTRQQRWQNGYISQTWNLGTEFIPQLTANWALGKKAILKQRISFHILRGMFTVCLSIHLGWTFPFGPRGINMEAYQELCFSILIGFLFRFSASTC